MQEKTKEHIAIIEHTLNNTPMQFVTKELLAKEITDITERKCTTFKVRRLLKVMGYSLKQLQINARNELIKQILIQNKGAITTPAILEILNEEKFIFGKSNLRQIVLKIRKENNLPTQRLINLEKIENYSHHVKEAMDYIENRDLGIITNPKIAHKIAKKHNVILSTYQIRKIRKLIDE